MSKLKDEGNEAFKDKDFQKAVELFTKAIGETPADHTIYSNRSASYYRLGKFELALEDGEKCVDLKPDWSKGWQRKALALHALGRKNEAMVAYERGYDVDPTNQVLMKEMSKLKVEIESERNAKEQ